jgi:hypothetical protein
VLLEGYHEQLTPENVPSPIGKPDMQDTCIAWRLKSIGAAIQSQ